MKNRSTTPVIIGTLYLITYIIFLHYEVSYPLVYTMFALSPMVVIYLAYAVLKYDVYKGPELEEEEWGYLDYDPYANERAQEGDLIKLK